MLVLNLFSEVVMIRIEETHLFFFPPEDVKNNKTKSWDSQVGISVLQLAMAVTRSQSLNFSGA